MGRFINADAFVSTGQGFTGNNMFVYCNNNPVCCADNNGYATVEVTRTGDSIVVTIEQEVNIGPAHFVIAFEAEFDFIEDLVFYIGDAELVFGSDTLHVNLGEHGTLHFPYNNDPSELSAEISTELFDQMYSVSAEKNESGVSVGISMEYGITSLSITITPKVDAIDFVEAVAPQSSPVAFGGGGGGKTNITGIGCGTPMRNPTMMMCFM